MRELELDGIHDDGDHIVLIDSDGERYTLRIDEALRAAVRRDRPALGLIQAADRTPVSPRQIQAMLRAGRGAEEIAEIADVAIEHVRRYEGPVVAEREWIAERARTFPIGRGGGPTLGGITRERLAARQARDGAQWDAWRRDDGTWTVQVIFEAGGRLREAHWHVDMTRQSVAADDDEARWLTDDDSAGDEPRGRARLTAITSRVYDVEADGGVDEDGESPERGTWPPSPRPTSASRDEHPSSFEEEDLDALNARRGLRTVPAPEASVWSSLDEDAVTQDEGSAEDASDRDADAIREHDTEVSWSGDSPDDPEVTDGFGEPEEDAGGADSPLEDEDPSEAPDGVGADTDVEDSSEGSEDPVEQDAHGDLTPLPGFDEEEPAEDPTETKPQRTKKSRGASKRTSMPSWDEIVFGSHKKND
ncbi:MAG: septation protein SepH [Brachybacterium sp.]|nr:septation protein SepH [Brachybacterium sp.]